MGKTLEDIEADIEREWEEKRTKKRIARGEIPDPMEPFRQELRRIFGGQKIKVRIRPTPSDRSAEHG